MFRLFAQVTLQFLASLVGLFIASIALDGFTINAAGFITSAVFFTVVNFIFEPLVIKLSLQYLPALRGGIALVTTLVGLWLTATFTEGLSISGASTWVLAPLIVWLSILLAGIILPLFLFKKTLQAVKNDSPSA